MKISTSFNLPFLQISKQVQGQTVREMDKSQTQHHATGCCDERGQYSMYGKKSIMTPDNSCSFLVSMTSLAHTLPPSFVFPQYNLTLFLQDHQKSSQCLCSVCFQEQIMSCPNPFILCQKLKEICALPFPYVTFLHKKARAGPCLFTRMKIR